MSSGNQEYQPNVKQVEQTVVSFSELKEQNIKSPFSNQLTSLSLSQVEIQVSESLGAKEIDTTLTKVDNQILGTNQDN